MFFSDDDLRSWEVDQIVARISELERTRRLLTQLEIEELSGLKQRLDTKRANCRHIYKLETWFNHVQRVCGVCGHVDKTYKHY